MKNQDRIKKKIQNMLRNMEHEIIAKHGSVKAFCEYADISTHNLSKVFNGHQEISTELFVRISIALEKMPQMVAFRTQHCYKTTLLEVLSSPYQELMLALLEYEE